MPEAGHVAEEIGPRRIHEEAPVGDITDVVLATFVMAEGRALFRVFPHNIPFPGFVLALTVLAVNMLGDGLRDTLDPHFGKRGDRP